MQIRAHVQRLRQNPKVNPDLAVGIRSPARWLGAEDFSLDGRPYDIVWCVGPLEARGRLTEYEAAPRGLVLVTPLDEHQLGADVLARLAKGRLETVRAWDILLEHFKARQLDSQLAGNGWIAEALLSLLPDGGFDAVPAGVLDAASVWKVLLTRKLGMGRHPVDLEALLAWTRSPDALRRHADLNEAFRRGLRDHLVSVCGPAAGAVLDTVDAGFGADAVPLGLVCRVVFDPSAGDVPSHAAGAVRMEKYTLDRPLSPLAARQWASAAEALVRQVQHSAGVNAARSLLTRGDQLLTDIKAQDAAHFSDVLPDGFERRLAAYAGRLTTWMGSRSAADLDKLATAGASVAAHDQATPQADRVRRVDMSLRLARFLARTTPPAVDESAPFEKLAAEYAADGGYVDWARGVLAGEGRAELADAFTQLTAAVGELREAQNERFARSLVGWTASDADPRAVLPIEFVLDRVVAPLAEHAPVLLLVMDGMGFAVYRELLEDLVAKQGWVQLERPEFPLGRPVVSTIPSVTQFARTTLLCGRLAQGGQAEAAAGFAAHAGLLAASRVGGHAQLFHKAELSEGAGNDLAADLRRAVGSNRRVVGVVINAVDDHLLKGDQVQARWTVEYIRALRPLLHEATVAGRTVILASDHGHVIDRQAEYRPSDRGERWRSAGSPPAAGELTIVGRRVLADGGRLTALWSEAVHFGVKRNGYHGGLAPQEMLAPLGVLVSATGKRPEGWAEVALYQPSWWDVAQPEVVVEVAPPHPETTLQTPTVTKPAESLFDIPAHVPTPAEKVPAASTSTTPPGWLEPLLASPVFVNQRKSAGRTAVADPVLRSILTTLAARGGKVLRPALARQLNLPPLRLPGIIAAVRRLLNFDGVDVLSVDEASDSVVLDLERLKVQFDVT